MHKVINRTVSGHGSELKIDFYYILTTAERANGVTDRTDFKIIFQPFIVLDIFGTFFNYLSKYLANLKLIRRTVLKLLYICFVHLQPIPKLHCLLS